MTKGGKGHVGAPSTQRSSRVGMTRDILDDVVIEVTARPSRSVAMMTAVALSVGALLCALGVSVTAARQVDASLAAATIDQLTVRAADSANTTATAVFPIDGPEQARAVDGVRAAGMYVDVRGTVTVAVARPFDRHPRPLDDYSLAGATSGFIDANRAEVSSDNRSLLDKDVSVVFVGEGMAAELDLPIVEDTTGLSVLINGQQFEVAGFLRGGLADSTRTILIPYAIANQWIQSDHDANMLIRTEPGAGTAVSGAIRLALRPDAPQLLDVSTVLDASESRAGVATQLDRLAAGVGALLLILSILLIANSMVVSVMARTAEIGLRRAIGSSARYVALLFLMEGGLTGFLGGLAGTAVALLSLVAICVANAWTLVLPWQVLVGGVVVGSLTGVLSSAYPAHRASRIEPAQAVRAD